MIGERKLRGGHQWTSPADHDYQKVPAVQLMDGTYLCGRPPTGWECTREPGHEGPCAAIPVVDTKSRHIECDRYTDWTPAFSLAKEQREAIGKWQIEHDTAKHMPPDGKGKGKFRYSGAIGGSYTWSFTPTSLGTVVTVKCSCGEKIDVSDYKDW